MGYRGTLRTIGAVARSIERGARRRQAELERQRKYATKMQDLERAEYEVSEYENRVELLQSIHKECGAAIDWKQLLETQPPREPDVITSAEEAARANMAKYRPGMIDRAFALEKKKRKKLEDALAVAVDTDKAEYQKEVEAYRKDYENWKQIAELARNVLSGDPQAYLSVIENENPFQEIEQFGSGLTFTPVGKDVLSASMTVKSPAFIPSEVKTLLKSGKLSMKAMPITKFNELYQDYTCSCSLRIARELFSLLPIRMAIVNVFGNFLNKATGHKENMPILSVAVSRPTLESLNLDTIDPSDSMSNFVHRMNFKKSEGFVPVALLDPKTLA